MDSILSKYRSAVILDDIEEIKDRAAKKKSRVDILEKDGKTSVKHFKTGFVETKGFDIPDNTLRTMVEEKGIPWDEGFIGRTIPYWASDERVDSHGDIVRQSWLFDFYKDNPVLAFNHQWDGLPVGNAIDWEIRSRVDKDYSGPALWLLGLFATPEMSLHADSVFRLAKSNILRAGSVGFKADIVIDIKDDDERSELGLGKWGFILENNHLLEFSPTMLGANGGARVLTLAQLHKAKKSGVTDGDFLVLRELYRQFLAENDRDKWKEIDAVLISFAKLLYPMSDWKRHRDLDAPLIQIETRKTGPKIKQDIGSLETMVADMMVLMQDSFVGLSQQLSDVRDLLESMTSGGPDDDDGNDDLDEETVSRIQQALNKFNALQGGLN